MDASASGTYKWDAAQSRVVKVSDRPRSSVPDVYFRGEEFVPHLGDDKHPFGQFVTSKQQKARIMREQGVHETGDRVHGARV